MNIMAKSIYTEAVDRDKPLDDYPRPMLERDAWINLNGVYEYAITPIDADRPHAYDGKILVPFCVESPLSGVARTLRPDQKLWYRRTFIAPVHAADERVILHFEAVDYVADIRINDRAVGSHVGGYLPFSFDVTDHLVSGENELVVTAVDSTDAGSQERGKQVLDPKGIWYTATSGIWQTVWMEVVNVLRLTALSLSPDYDASEVRVRPTLSHAIDAKIVFHVLDGTRDLLSVDLDPDDETRISLPGFRPWSPESPFLYGVKVEIRREDSVVDAVKSYFGMRKIDIANDLAGIPRIHLNGKPYVQTGVLDQGYWPDGLLTQPTDQALIDDIVTMKNLGFNMLRKHIKIESERWYWHCDRLGMLVWQDMPSGGSDALGPWLGAIRPYAFPHLPMSDRRFNRFGRGDERCRTEFLNGLAGMIDLLANHPSIVCWVPFNEAWGQFDAKATAAYVKSLDPTRLVDHASGWYDRGGGDLVSIHRYILKVKAPRPEKRRAFVLSEFGGYSRLVAGHVWNPDGAFGYRMYSSREEITSAYEALMRDQIAPLVKKGLCATVYTQLSDVELEVNGLLTYDRSEIKIDEATILRWNENLRQ